MMLTFPVLSVDIDWNTFKEEQLIDPVVRNTSEAGYTKSRLRFTRVPLKFSFTIPLLSETDKDALKQLEIDSGYGAESFEWVCPWDGVTRELQLSQKIEFSMQAGRIFWSAKVVVNEI